MKLLYSWLGEYVNLKGVDHKVLADSLVNIGFEVEEVVDCSKGISKIYVGKITQIDKHPNADKLQVCQLDFGNGEKLQIVTGAKNVAVGQLVPVAKSGAVLADGSIINNGNLRGVDSFGMLCGGSEIGVDDNLVDGASVDGILILPKNFKVGVDLKEALGLIDYIFDVSITANRPDCQSVYGIAREIAAKLKKPLKPLELSHKHAKPDSKFVKKITEIKIENNEICSRYAGAYVQNINIKPSSGLIRRRLALLGQKPINNIVDITNYVLLEVGQPLHAFDADKLGSSIVVRKAKNGETLKLLNDTTVELKDNITVIADNNNPLAIAGIMGGEPSSVTNNTTSILLESARFSRGDIRQGARSLGLKTDSSARNEKGTDYALVDVGVNRALSLMTKDGAAVVYKLENSVPKPKNTVIKTSTDKINAILGIKVESKKIVEILSNLEINTVLDGNNLKCTIPLFREDIVDVPCLAEEVIRFYGYDKIVSTNFNGGAVSAGGYLPHEKNIKKIKQALVGFGAHEIITYSFIAESELEKLQIDSSNSLPNCIKIINPLSSEYAIMRTQLVGGMLSSVKHNISRKNKDFRLFEVSRTFKADELPLKKLPQELETLCVCFVGGTDDFYSIKNVANAIGEMFGVEFVYTVPAVTLTDFQHSEQICPWLHQGISAHIWTGGGAIATNCVGSVGKIHPTVAKNYDIHENVFILQLDISILINKRQKNVREKRLGKFPSVERDLAVVVKVDTPVGDMIKLVEQTAGELCESVELFDVYTGEQIENGFKSVALSITLRDSTKTLLDAQIQEVMANVLVALQSKFDAKLR